MQPSLELEPHEEDRARDLDTGTAGHLKRRGTPWQSAEVLEIIDETVDAVTLRLGLEVSADFLPGQYYNVRLSVPGRTGPIQRAYSIASSPIPNPSIIDVGIREVPGGLVSPRLVGELSPG
ncbi:MAG: FAD-binding oxidoreductase, partial [Acidimicrobiales bacterium]